MSHDRLPAEFLVAIGPNAISNHAEARNALTGRPAKRGTAVYGQQGQGPLRKI